ncbi:prolyl oligopeptidase family serine peptidase [Nakamurella leprariae]|uniref:S9 family peptidase n=1 Tax=Nakamurella leprariae TaxID=2803911 RepID=A0A938YDM2_9ACTN|nr:prolyl oligopeptidase family serine peptidase [Nakamurella leprariae]MBM9465813.1 S9 family peptidase [Nakamurella leprariae]
MRFAGEQVWWSEGRPSEGGRVVVCRAGADGEPPVVDLLPAPWNARTRVHEYGGVSWIPVPRSPADSTDPTDEVPLLAFVEFTDQRLYLLDPLQPDAAPRPLTPSPDEPAGVRYGDFSWDPQRSRLLAVCERHLPAAEERPRITRTVVGIPVDGRGALDADLVEDVLRDVPTADFLASPQLSPDGRELVWISWNHPAMPWDGTVLHLAEMGPGGRATGARSVAGGPNVSVVEPRFVPSNDARVLIVAQSDATGFWRPTLVDPHAGTATPLTDHPADFTGPQWQLGHGSWGRLPDGTVITVPAGRLGVLAADSTEPVPVDERWSWCGDLQIGPDGSVAAVVGGDRIATSVVHLPPGQLGAPQVLRRATDTELDAAWIPEAITRTVDGVHVVIHPPTNPHHTAAPGTSPAVLEIHGGPTAQWPRVRSARTAYFTSRGFTVVGVDHRGSTGYGREYRDALRGRWAGADIDDAIAVARALLADGTIGAALIAGGSAGGLTVLGTVTRPDHPFAGGMSSYGIADLVALGEHTHDFESRYLESLLGPDRQVWVDRSPLTAAGTLRTPVLLLQGGLDPVVPPEQAQVFADACAARGVPHALVLFPQESHGFRAAAARVTALEAELSFAGQVLGFEPPGVPRLPLRTGDSGQAE